MIISFNSSENQTDLNCLRFSSDRTVNTLRLGYKTNHLLLCTEINVACSEIYRKHKFTVGYLKAKPCGI